MDLSRIKYQYALTRERNAREHIERLSRAEDACPGIVALTEEELWTRYMRVGAELGEGDAAGLSHRLEELERKKEALLALAGLPADYLDPVYDCPVCHDTGYAGGEICGCLRARLKEDRSAELGIDGSISFASFDEKCYPGAGKVKRLLLDIVAGTDGRPFCLLSGGTGTGKSYAMRCAARELIARGRRPLYISAYELFSDFHEHRLGKDVSIGRYINADALFLDDLGTEPVTQNVTVEYFYNLINRRYEAGALTFIATNLDRAQLLERYQERTVSRLFDKRSSLILTFKGKDLRTG